MKIWLNNLSLGDSFWYHNYQRVKYGTIIDRVSDNRYRVDRWRLDTGDDLFVNQFGYSTCEEASAALLTYCKREIESKRTQISILDDDIEGLNKICKYLTEFLSSSIKANA